MKERELRKSRKEITKEANKIFKQMMRLFKAGQCKSDEYGQLLAKYEKLVDRENDIMDQLGISTANPCPIKPDDLPCCKCTGWHEGKKMSKEGIGTECILHQVKPSGDDLFLMRDLLKHCRNR